MKKIIFIGGLLRLTVILLSREVSNYDLNSYFRVGQAVIDRVNIYPDIASRHHPYLPLFLYLEGLAYLFFRVYLLMITVIECNVSLVDISNI
ncbi:MAG: hypothetical protein NZL96_00075 [Patescibacteria group bacterium]|nr:hypothetical protein [Patescibacteria group bacterium]